ncbi:MAG TPA: TIR-like domain-containing protein [Thiotrichaceae bacterium]|nr:TIR-like domain-containing protein [Thiotrichaceae bacterium]
MAKKKVFVSYDYDNDKHYKNLLLAWDANKQFDFYLYDQSADVSVNSTDAAAIKRVVSARINASTYFLCIVGKHTHKSGWVAWEIDKAVELGKKIVAVKTDRSNTTPDGLYGIGTSWAMSFTFDSIKNAIDNA